MLEIFIQDKSIFIPTSDKDIAQLLNPISVNSKKDIENIFQKFLHSSEKFIYLTSDKIKLLPDLFYSNFKIVEAAGGLVRNKEGNYLFIFRNGFWDLPKGKLEKGEKIDVCAIREVEEECKISGLKIIRNLPTTYHMYELLHKKWAIKICYWYEMQTEDTSTPVPQTEEGITQAVWLNNNEIAKVKSNTYPSILQLINYAIK
jgi:ADP-ribose pyrophosphatase YjhB (NUDIX family)